MDPVNALKGYGKVEGAEKVFPEENRRRRRRRLAVAGIFAAVLLLLALATAIVALVLRHNSHPGGENSHPGGENSQPGGDTSPSPPGSLEVVCGVAKDRESCYSSLAAAGANSSTDPEEIFRISLKVAVAEIVRISGTPDTIAKGVDNKRAVEALQVCTEMLIDATDRVNTSLESIRPATVPGEKILTPSNIDDLKTWLSAALTDQDTCLDSFDGVGGGFLEKMALTMRNATLYTSNSLAIAAHILEIREQLHIPVHRKLLSHD